MKNNLALTILLVLIPLAFLIISIVTPNKTFEKGSSFLFGITIMALINALKRLYRYHQTSNNHNIYEK